MSDGPHKKKGRLAFVTGWCAGSAMRAARGVLPGAGSRDAELCRLREGMFEALHRLHAVAVESESGTGGAEDVAAVLAKAKELGRAILDSAPRGTQGWIRLDEIAKVDVPGVGGRGARGIDERAVRRNRCSIARFGLLNPLVVRRAGDRYELLQGGARCEACRRLGLRAVPAVVKAVGDAEAVELALLDMLFGNGPPRMERECLRAALKFYTEP